MNTAGFDGSNFKILIIDDSTTNLSVIGEFLQEYHLQMLSAVDGETGLRRARRARPDLILLDVMMPGIDGFEVCRQLKSDESTQTIPIIFMTALSDEESKVKGFEAGGVDYITKPILRGELLARVITHLRLRSLTRSLQEQNKELEAFAHTVAHDLRNPLNMIATASICLRSVEFPEQKDDVEMILDGIETGVRRMNSIIRSLLLLATARAGEVSMHPLDMKAIVAEALDRLAQEIQGRGAGIIKPPGWPSAMGYGPWITEAWANYIGNAVKYGGRDDLQPPVPPQIKLGADKETSGFVRFWVRDNGPGIDKEDQARLFVPFNRLSVGRADGHGLGLSIVQRIVERLGGQVGVDSEPGKGSTFYFTVPAG